MTDEKKDTGEGERQEHAKIEILLLSTHSARYDITAGTALGLRMSQGKMKENECKSMIGKIREIERRKVIACNKLCECSRCCLCLWQNEYTLDARCVMCMHLQRTKKTNSIGTNLQQSASSHYPHLSLTTD